MLDHEVTLRLEAVNGRHAKNCKEKRQSVGPGEQVNLPYQS